MESYLYAAYPPYSYRYPPPKAKGGPGGWRPRGGYLAGYGEAAAAAAEYFDDYQRAQLKAILSQVNPNLTPRLRKANTKEVGVQVNPRQDASVQCSLGPRTLLRRRPGPATSRPREAAPEPQPEPDQEQGSPATTSTRAVRFPRTVAVYSPVASRRITAFNEEPREPREPPAPAAVEEERREAEAVRASWEEPAEAGPGAGAGLSVSLGNGRVRQFLEQKYGYYHCKDCNVRWESAYVWCVQGTNKVYFRQFCRTCQKSYNPYRVEDITCQSCKQTRCTCPVKLRHVDPKRPHRQDLCGRCKGKRLSCDSTFSFKYII
uniref:Zygote arrest 1 n=1 Tax=Coturnix japonica TaxID=93934 RepID=A0A8C2U1E5_COTJA